MDEPTPPATAPRSDFGAVPEPRRALEQAREQASAQGKRVAVVFGADWCPDCHAFAAALEHPLVAPLLAAGYVVVRVDVGNRDRHLDLAAELGVRVERGIPAVAFLEPDGPLLGATRDGELADARSMAVVDVVRLLHRWAPERLRNGDREG